MLSTRQKTLEVNLDPAPYGTFAEIGGGQEVARWFFRVGGAAGTVAETISAYDKEVSDDRYGRGGRYVSRERLRAMLDHEYRSLIAKLAPKRGATTTFFAFADTVATAAYSRPGHGDAWLGVRFQTQPGAEPCEILVHAQLLDREPKRQQSALGVLGVNLVYAALRSYGSPFELVATLRDGLDPLRVEIDVVHLDGPAFAGVDNRLVSLQLVERRFTSAALFTANGDMVQPSEVLYKRPILVERGRFRPITTLGLSILERARDQFLAEPGVAGEEPVVMAEMTLKGLADGAPTYDHADFLARARTLCSLGLPVLVSNFARYFHLAEYLAKHTTKRIAIAVGLPTVAEILNDRYYDDLAGGALESFGRMFKNNVNLYVYPQRDERSGRTLTLDDFDAPGALGFLTRFLIATGRLQPIRRWDAEHLDARAEIVRAQIESGDVAWERAVPAAVAATIKRERLFGYRAPS